MIRHTLVESQGQALQLDEAQAEALEILGRRLASRRDWWGSQPGDEEPVDRSVIRAHRKDSLTWDVRVVDAVGVIAVPGLEIVVQPKIPVSHLVYLLSKAGLTPRLDESAAGLSASKDLWELVSLWFVGAAERVLRRGLIRDYRPERRDLAIIRGRLEPLGTARAIYRGRAQLPCEFEEFDEDNAPNRVLLAASQTIAGSALLSRDLRRRARRVSLRMDGVSELRLGDLSARPERRSSYYADALLLARHILGAVGRSLETGEMQSWAFLIRTPEAVEAGIRGALAERLASDAVITKRRITLSPTKLTMAPDLVFEDAHAVGDVKYRIASGDWPRSALYQATAFATAFEAPSAVVVSFRRPHVPQPPDVQVGRVQVVSRSWLCDETIPPAQAADLLTIEIRHWLSALPSESAP